MWHKCPIDGYPTIEVYETPEAEAPRKVGPTDSVPITIAVRKADEESLRTIDRSIAALEKKLHDAMATKQIAEREASQGRPAPPELGLQDATTELQKASEELAAARQALAAVADQPKTKQKGQLSAVKKLVKVVAKLEGRVEKSRASVEAYLKARAEKIASLPQLEEQLRQLKDQRDATWEQLKEEGKYDTKVKTLGVAATNLIVKDRTVGPRIESPQRKAESEYHAFCEEAGYDLKERSEAPDHVTELSLSGPDNFANLWPLPSQKNKAPDQLIDLDTGLEVGQFEGAGQKGASVSRDLTVFKDKYFLIRGFKAT
jgi:hypothetical protein